MRAMSAAVKRVPMELSMSVVKELCLLQGSLQATR
jgi:hypothetical protein